MVAEMDSCKSVEVGPSKQLKHSQLKRESSRKPNSAISEERKQRNRRAQAAFRERLTEYSKQLGEFSHASPRQGKEIRDVGIAPGLKGSRSPYDNLSSWPDFGPKVSPALICRLDSKEKYLKRSSSKRRSRVAAKISYDERALERFTRDDISRLPKELTQLDYVVRSGCPNVPVYSAERWGRYSVVAWKETSGASKDWRAFKYLKATKEHSVNLSFFESSQYNAPVSFLRRYKSFKLYSRRIRDQKEPYSSRNQPQDFRIDFRNAWQEIISDEQESSREGETDVLDSLVSQRYLLDQPLNNLHYCRSQTIDTTNLVLRIPYENFIGAILGNSFRLMGILRFESHGEIYAVSDLHSSKTFEAKAYQLRGASRKERFYHVRNMKKLNLNCAVVATIDQHDRKFIVYQLSRPKKIAESCKLGAIGRRNTPEFDVAFPKLNTNGSNCPPVDDFTSYVLVERELPLVSDAADPSTVIKLDVEQSSANVKRRQNPQRKDRIREKQRLDRIAKRARKRELKMSAKNAENAEQALVSDSGIDVLIREHELVRQPTMKAKIDILIREHELAQQVARKKASKPDGSEDGNENCESPTPDRESSPTVGNFLEQVAPNWYGYLPLGVVIIEPPALERERIPSLRDERKMGWLKRRKALKKERVAMYARAFAGW